MGSRPMFPLLISMALPPCVSMLIQSLYNIIDSFYVAKLGEEALTAVSLAFPLQNLVLSLAVGLGVAMNASVARNLGMGSREEADSSVMHGLVLAGVHSLLFLCVGLFLSRPFIAMFTSNANILTWGTEYCRIVICLAFGSIFHIALEKVFQSVGNMVVPMFLQAIGAVVNIILDPIFIFGYLGVPAMGVKGAAIATIIGQFSACLLAFLWFFKCRLPVRIRFRHMKLSGQKIRELYIVAIPSAFVMAIPSTLVALLNTLLIGFSQTAVAVFGVYFKLQTFVNMPASGLVQGMRPIISYNYGAGNPSRMKEAIRDSLFIAGGIMAVGSIGFILFASQIMSAFSQDPGMIAMGIQALRIISTGFLFSVPAIIFSGALEALGKGIQSLIIVFLRQLLFVPLLALLLSRFLGLTGIWAAFPAAEVLGAAAACLIGLTFLRRFMLPKQQKEMS